MNHSFDINVAKEYGILEAVFLNNLYFWIQRNEANDENFHDGRYWTYNTSKALSELFPYASKKQIERVIQHLREEGLLVTGNYNPQKFDRTLWYSLTDKGKVLLTRTDIDFPNSGNAFPAEGTPIPYINTDINILKENPLMGVREKRTNFPPTLEDVKAYCREAGVDIDAERFIDYYEANGWMVGKNKMKSWKAAVRNWARNSSNGRPQKKKSEDEFDFDAWMAQKKAEGAFDD